MGSKIGRFDECALEEVPLAANLLLLQLENEPSDLPSEMNGDAVNWTSNFIREKRGLTTS